MNVDNRAVYNRPRFFPRLFFSLNRKSEIRGRKTKVGIGNFEGEESSLSLSLSLSLCLSLSIISPSSSPRFEMANLAWRVPRVREGGCCSREDGERGERLGDKNTTEDFSHPRGAFPRNSIRANYPVRSSSVGFNHGPARPCNILLLCHLPSKEDEETIRGD